MLNVGYAEAGPPNGSPVILLHGWPYDIHDYIEVAPILAAQGYRVIVPHLRGHGSTRFLDTATPRSGQQAAIGVDVIALMDALKIPTAVLAGYDWGGRAACVVAALWPERCAGLVSVNDYLIQDIAHAGTPLPAKLEWGIWTQFYFATERGRTGLAANRNDIARLLWTNENPTWRFDDATFQRSAASFDNPDYVDVVIHSYRHRLGWHPVIRNMRMSRRSSRRYPSSRCPPSRSTGRLTASSLPAMAGLPRPSSRADESTIGCRMRATPYRSKRRRSSPTQSWK